MSATSNIEWTDTTWNPVVGCTRVSAGCDNCYAVGMTNRLDGMSRGGPNPGKGRTAQYRGLTVLNKRGERHFNGIVRTVPEALDLPLRWKNPRRIFVNSMSDLFHKDVPWTFIIQVLSVAKVCPRHTFQILTKRPEIAAAFLKRFPCLSNIPNVWIGTSCEDQDAAESRIGHLIDCPASVRFLSIEPMLGAIDLQLRHGCRGCNHPGNIIVSGFPCSVCGGSGHEPSGIDWVIVGGESGPNARACNVEWIRSIVWQCKKASVPVFVKQLGSRPLAHVVGADGLAWPAGTMLKGDGVVAPDGVCEFSLKSKKGGDMAEWPVDLRVREFPEVAHA